MDQIMHSQTMGIQLQTNQRSFGVIKFSESKIGQPVNILNL